MISQIFCPIPQVGAEVAKKWSTLPKGEHIPLRQHMLAVALKSMMCSAFGLKMNSTKDILEFEKGYDLVSFYFRLGTPETT